MFEEGFNSDALTAGAESAGVASVRLSREDAERLDVLYRELVGVTGRMLGYPVSQDFDCRGLERFLRLPLNNLGDPFVDSTYQIGTRELEREVVGFAAQLLRGPPGETWGYVTHGGTEGNLYGLYLARELFPEAVVYCSGDTHYSVSKNIQVLGMRSITVRSQRSGEIDYDDLGATLRVNRQRPAILVANIGTTMTEARDDVQHLKRVLRAESIQGSYIHADAALCGAYAPFLRPRPAFDFADGADSISISGHKFIGVPMPCGIVLARKAHVDRIARSIGYIGSLDTTIGGSRNGFAALALWYRIRCLGAQGLRERASKALVLAAYAEARLRNAGVAAWRNPQALTVVFPKVAESIQRRWQLATEGKLSHLVVMPSVTRAQIDALVDDLVAAGEGRAGAVEGLEDCAS